jgi:hypothetical protein
MVVKRIARLSRQRAGFFDTITKIVAIVLLKLTRIFKEGIDN